MRLNDLLFFSLSNLWKNKVRMLLTVSAIFIGSCTLALTQSINTGVTTYIENQLSSLGGQDQLTILPKKDAFSTSGFSKAVPEEYDPELQTGNPLFDTFSDQDIEDIRNIDGIKVAQPYQTLTIDYIQGENKQQFIFRGHRHNDYNLDLEVGREVDNNSDNYEITLASEYVEVLGYSDAKDAIDKKVKIGVSSQTSNKQEILEATIVGVRNFSLIQGGESLVNQSLSDKINEVNEQEMPENLKNNYIAMYATVSKNYAEMNMGAIKETIDEMGFTALTVDDEFNLIKQIVNTIAGVLSIFAGISLVAAGFGIINTLYMSVQDRTREIGLMKALGLSRVKVFLIFTFEALFIGLIGGGAGVITSYFISTSINKYAREHLLGNLPGFHLFQFTISSGLTIIGIILIVSLLAGTFPANRASKLDPIKALKYE